MSVEFININRIIQSFTQNLVNGVMNNCLHSGNIIYSPTGQQVVPPNILDSPNNVPGAYIGTVNSMITANTVYNGLLSVTKWLLRVGTYSYYEYKTCTGFSHDRTNEWRSSGKALFNSEYARSHFNCDTSLVNINPNPGNVISSRLITINDINTLISNCFNSWNDTNKPIYTKEYSYCHDSCYSNCYDDCYSDYKDNYICYGPETGYCHGCYR